MNAQSNTEPLALAAPLSSAACPITYRDLHEEAAGMGLEARFFTISGIDPDAAVKCNCAFDAGHESHCDIVLANEILRRRNNKAEGAAQ
jgi:hypothetical protein